MTDTKLDVKELRADVESVLQEVPIYADAVYSEILKRVRPRLLASETQAAANDSTELPRRLGHYFEWLVLLILRASAPEFLIRNTRVRVFDPDRGEELDAEFDFLFRWPGEKRIRHLEVAAKYYLLAESRGENQWIGPGRRDSLKKKYRHMKDQQLRRLKTEAAQAKLFSHLRDLGLAIGPADTITSEMVIHGKLFAPRESALPELPPGCIRPVDYVWMTHSELWKQAKPTASIAYFEKPRWFSRLGQKEAPSVLLCRSDEPVPIYWEGKMAFVVSDDWDERPIAL